MLQMDRHTKAHGGRLTKTRTLIGLHAGAKGTQPQFLAVSVRDRRKLTISQLLFSDVLWGADPASGSEGPDVYLDLPQLPGGK